MSFTTKATDHPNCPSYLSPPPTGYPWRGNNDHRNYPMRSPPVSTLRKTTIIGICYHPSGYGETIVPFFFIYARKKKKYSDHFSTSLFLARRRRRDHTQKDLLIRVGRFFFERGDKLSSATSVPQQANRGGDSTSLWHFLVDGRPDL